jgi:pimeloyl-ACP methyl ester carboxylesterase
MKAVLRLILKALRLASPAGAAWLADRLLCTPPRVRVTRPVRAFLRTGRRFGLTVGGRRVAAWSWGEGPAVLLVHGWGSCGGHLGDYAAPLIASGYAVVTFDAPGHGASGWGISSLPEFARSILAADRLRGPFHAVIAHSLGSAAAALAVRWGLEPARVALISAPAHPPRWLPDFAERMDIDADVVTRMRERMERRLGVPWDELDVVAAARRATAPALVVHDRKDRRVPWREGAAVAAAWPGARLVITEGLGHRDVVRHPEVVRTVTEFVTRREPR